jgi:hypothetical protein
VKEFRAAQTLRELWRLDLQEYWQGWAQGEQGYGEPIQCTRSFWHGWLFGAAAAGHISKEHPVVKLVNADSAVNLVQSDTLH